MLVEKMEKGAVALRKPTIKMKDMTSKKFGRLTVLGFVKSVKEQHYWLVACDCGKEKLVSGANMRSGLTQSCGCYRAELVKKALTKHGSVKNPGYFSWVNMKVRCKSQNYQGYKYYGGRGIKVCDRWNLFSNFLLDMGKRPKNTTLDRIDSDGNYEPGNCRWATHKQQANNKKKRKVNCE